MHHPVAEPLDDAVRSLFAVLFEPQTLQGVRVRGVDSIDNPRFYSELAALGLSIPLDFSWMAGITFIDTFLVSRAMVIPEAEAVVAHAFHECVHVAQYRHLGVDRFVDEYVNGWVRGGFNYADIPLERHAYDLQARFTSAPFAPFSVDALTREQFPVTATR